MMATYVVRGGTVFDGNGGEPRRADVLIRDGKVVSLLDAGACQNVDAEEIDARGKWVMPGFVDLHTHYDAEVELRPALSESVRHGVTTIALGSCGLSMAVGNARDLADMFCRVEGIPRDIVFPLLQDLVTWSGPAGYLDHLDTLALGPNVAAMLGHSTIRAAAMGIGRSVDPKAKPTQTEMDAMLSMIDEALDAGYIGLSVNTLPWDKMDGEEHRSSPTPSVFASWKEYRALTAPLRARGRVFQGVPNIETKVNAVLFMIESLGIFRPSLKTMIIAMMDPRAARMTVPLVDPVVRLFNALGARFRLQALPNVFDLWTDGLEVPILEEIGAGTEALHLTNLTARADLLRDPAYRARFKRDWGRAILGKAYHRNLAETKIIDAPDASLIGKSFAEVGEERGISAVDAFLDCQADHGNDLRWYTIVANDRPEWLRKIVNHPGILVGFSDAGAHLRNMAFYNFPLRLLKMVQDAEREGRPIMTISRAVQRLTSEIADYLGLDVGRLAPGARADLVVVDPDHLDDSVEALHEAKMDGFDGLRRLVRRNDDAVPLVMIGGKPAWSNGSFADDLGSSRGYGQALRVASSAA